MSVQRNVDTGEQCRLDYHNHIRAEYLTRLSYNISLNDNTLLLTSRHEELSRMPDIHLAMHTKTLYNNITATTTERINSPRFLSSRANLQVLFLASPTELESSA